MKKVILAVFVISFAMCCSSSKKTVTNKVMTDNAAVEGGTNSANTEIEKAKSAKPAVKLVKSAATVDLLPEAKQGKILYEDKCGACHSLKNPTFKTAEQWPGIVAGMVKKANKREVAINEQQEAMILEYLVTMCNASKAK